MLERSIYLIWPIELIYKDLKELDWTSTEGIDNKTSENWITLFSSDIDDAFSSVVFLIL